MDSDFDEKSPGDIDSGRARDIKENLKKQLSFEKHDDARIELFKKVVEHGICAFWSVWFLLFMVVGSYVILLFFKPKEIPENFWHIPTLVSLITATILISLLKLTSSFGSFINNKSKEKQENSSVNTSDQEPSNGSEYWFIDVLKGFKEDVIEFLKK